MGLLTTFGKILIGEPRTLLMVTMMSWSKYSMSIVLAALTLLYLERHD